MDNLGLELEKRYEKDALAEYLLDQDGSNPLCTDKNTFRKTLCCILLWIYTHVKLEGEFVVNGLDTQLTPPLAAIPENEFSIRLVDD